MVKQVESEEEFKALIAGEKPVIVDFTASWCGPCKMIGPFFAEISEKYPGITFVKVDVDELDAVAADCGVQAMPTFQVYKAGAKVDEMCGAAKDKLEALVQKHQ